MNTDIITVAYLNRISTKKDGKFSIYSRTLHEVLEEQHAMDKPEDKVFEDEMSARDYKSSKPGIFPIALPYDSASYTDDVFKRGHTVLVDIDTTELADEVFSRADAIFPFQIIDRRFGFGHDAQRNPLAVLRASDIRRMGIIQILSRVKAKEIIRGVDIQFRKQSETLRSDSF